VSDEIQRGLLAIEWEPKDAADNNPQPVVVFGNLVAARSSSLFVIVATAFLSFPLLCLCSFASIILPNCQTFTTEINHTNE
jgi:hypothetical protein